MTNDSESPFSAKRYEHDGNHVYYLPPSVFGLLETPIPTLLVGTRGTGKTTLLKALNWEDRLDNARLKQQLDKPPFSASYIGLYFKLPNYQLALLDRWLTGVEDSDYASIFAFYLDLCWLETVAPALKHLAAAQLLNVTAEAEQEFIVGWDAIMADCNVVEALVGQRPTTIQSALATMHPMRKMLEKFARKSVDYAEVMELLPIGQIGSFGRDVGRLLMDAVDGANGDGDHQWSLRVCMDEGETLTLKQQRVINSMIRLAEWPVFYLVAYVSRPRDVTGTFLPNQTLQVADRQIHVLDAMKKSEFKTLAQGVINVRLASMAVSPEFRVNQVLGKLNLNALLMQILKSSESEFASDLIARATEDQGSKSDPPIYETYLQIERPSALQSDGTRRELRRLSSQSVRKPNVASYLSICNRTGADPWYASADMVLQMSDNCIRDFLRQMEFIFIENAKPLDAFLKGRVNDKVQNDGIRNAARLKMTLFRERIISSHTEANQFVDGLARVIALIQGTGRNAEQLSTPERGIFRYVTRDASGSETPSRNELLIREATEAGFLRLLSNESTDELRFRVHASLAPHYGFSYRGAYYDACVLSDSDVDAFRYSRTVRDRDRAVASITQRLGGRRGRNASSDKPLISGMEEE
jgi:hypothetical protein